MHYLLFKMYSKEVDVLHGAWYNMFTIFLASNTISNSGILQLSIFIVQKVLIPNTCGSRPYDQHVFSNISLLY